MKNFTKSIPSLFTFLIVLIFNAKAQWTVLPDAPYNVNYILPYADDKILYSSLKTGGSHANTDSYIHISKDNLTSSKVVSNIYGSMNCCNAVSFAAFNDSTFSYLLYGYSAYKPYFTQNEFQTNVEMPEAVVFYSGAGQTATSNFLYLVGMQDSVKICRMSKTGTAIAKHTIPVYIPQSDKLKFLNDSVGFTLAYFKSNPNKSTLIKTNNYGRSWASLATDSINPIVDYQFFSSGEIYLLKKSGAVSKSYNGGSSFTSLSVAPQGTYTCIRMANNITGFIGGENGVLLKTKDGGNAWISEISNTTQRIKGIYTFNYSSYFVDASNRVYLSQQPLGITEKVWNTTALDLYPNPVNSKLNVKYSLTGADKVLLEINDISGKKLLEMPFSQSCELDVSGFSEGIYFVKILMEGQVSAVQKLIITK